MIAVRIYKQNELLQKLSAYKCRKLMQLSAAAELWETGWGSAFTLYNENGWYDEWQYREVLKFVAETMPSDWNGEDSA